jgi:diguanylate cyclase (GGDEF)-like protein
MSLIWFGLACFLQGLCFVGGRYVYAAVFSAPCFFMAWFTWRLGSKPASKGNIDWDQNDNRELFLKRKGVNGQSVKPTIVSLRESRKKNLEELEETIDRTLLDALSVLKQAVSATTLGLFFPHRIDGVYLRVWITQCDSIIPGARISSGQGLVGLLLKERVSRVLEHDILANSTQLHYYSNDEGIRSIAGVPIIVNGVKRGALVADSLKEKSFSQETVVLLENFASVIGQFMYYGYISFENSYQRDQLAALTDYQRKFLENMTEPEIIGFLQQYIQQSLEVERIMLIARVLRAPGTARVISCIGIDEEFYRDFSFNLSETGLVNLVFEKEQIINRSFSRIDRVPRLSIKECNNDALKSLLAVPVRTDKGVTHVLMVESVRPRWFTSHHKELLLTISRAAGFALSRARLYKEKELMACRDGLTGLINHKTFHELHHKETLRAKRENYPITVLMLDIDFFKNVNDKYGHPVGDVVLKEISRIISTFIRTGKDAAARYGGEEFVCALVNSGLDASRETAERIRMSVEKKEFNIGQSKRLKLTISIGGAVYPDDARHGKDALEKADKALYHAKKMGRNKVVFYSD